MPMINIGALFHISWPQIPRGQNFLDTQLPAFYTSLKVKRSLKQVVTFNNAYAQF